MQHTDVDQSPLTSPHTNQHLAGRTLAAGNRPMHSPQPSLIVGGFTSPEEGIIDRLGQHGRGQ